MEEELTDEQKRVLNLLKQYGGSSKAVAISDHDDSSVYDELEKLGLIKRIPMEGGSGGVYYEIANKGSK